MYLNYARLSMFSNKLDIAGIKPYAIYFLSLDSSVLTMITLSSSFIKKINSYSFWQFMLTISFYALSLLLSLNTLSQP